MNKELRIAPHPRTAANRSKDGIIFFTSLFGVPSVRRRGSIFDILIGLCLLAGARPAGAQTAGEPLNAWQNGQLEIHFIHTGRGSCAYYI
ncbi:MAG: hypothetical protein H7Z75_01360, partial [Ferruginibacter sp.]|nr:hypothetical protein [Cytophagales bacterium]